MKRGLLPNGSEVFTFGSNNSLKIFPPNTFKFKPKGHIYIDEIQQCILDNFWFQHNVKKEETGYMLSILNSLAEYFNMMNKKVPKSANIKTEELIALYVLYDGNKPGIYFTFEEILKQKLEARKIKMDLSWRKYYDINEALRYAREMIGENYYIEPKAKEYIQKYRGGGTSAPTSPNYTKGEASTSSKVKEELLFLMKEEESPKYQTYKSCLLKGLDPLDSEYIDMKIDEKFQEVKKLIKEELKEDILKELRKSLIESLKK